MKLGCLKCGPNPARFLGIEVIPWKGSSKERGLSLSSKLVHQDSHFNSSCLHFSFFRSGPHQLFSSPVCSVASKTTWNETAVWSLSDGQSYQLWRGNYRLSWTPTISNTSATHVGCPVLFANVGWIDLSDLFYLLSRSFKTLKWTKVLLFCPLTHLPPLHAVIWNVFNHGQPFILKTGKTDLSANSLGKAIQRYECVAAKVEMKISYHVLFW